MKKKPAVVPEKVMKQIYEEVKTPYKYGIILLPDEKKTIDCPGVFRYGNRWYMFYVEYDEATSKGYETGLAVSDDLLNWKSIGKALTPTGEGWDTNQAAGYPALQDTAWEGSYELQKYDGKYWMTDICGKLAGLETEPLAVGVAYTTTPDKPIEWKRIKENPVLSTEDPDVRWFEAQTLYKSNIIWDKDETLGHQFVMYYNGKQKVEWIERIGMAVSDDMIHWKRHGTEPVIDTPIGISGDPQIQRIGDVWVMFYFGAWWRPKAFDNFACSYDLEHWTKWEGPSLIEPTEPWDDTFAHKPWVIKHKGIVYHFYCSVGNRGRCLALATSKILGKSALM